MEASSSNAAQLYARHGFNVVERFGLGCGDSPVTFHIMTRLAHSTAPGHRPNAEP